MFPGDLYCRYLDSVTNKDSTLPPIPHLHSLLTDNGEPHPEVDIFKLVRSSYDVSLVVVSVRDIWNECKLLFNVQFLTNSSKCDHSVYSILNFSMQMYHSPADYIIWFIKYIIYTFFSVACFLTIPNDGLPSK